MKKLSYLIAFVVAICLVACEEKGNIPSPGNNDYNLQGSGLQDIQMDDTTGLNIPANAITVSEALAICRSLASGKTTTETYIIAGMIRSVDSNVNYTNTNEATFYIVDIEHPFMFDQLECFKVKNIGNTGYDYAGYSIVPGTVVVLQAKLTNYSGTLETAQGSSVLLKTTFKEVFETEGNGTFENPYTIADVVLMRSHVTDSAYVRGIIVGAIIDESAPFTGGNIEFAAPFTKASNIVLADNLDEKNVDNLAPVEVPNRRGAYRYLYSGLNLNANPDNLGKEVILYGMPNKFSEQGIHGVIGVTRVWIDGKEIVEE